MKVIALIVLLMGVANECMCQRYFYHSSRTNFAASANYSESIADAFSCVSNPALVSSLSQFEAGIFCEKRYSTAELMLMNISAAANNGTHGIAISFQHFGGVLYNEKFMSLGYGRTIGNIHLGISFSLLGVNTKGYPTENFVGAGLHSVWKLNDNVSVAFSMMNPHSMLIRTASDDAILPPTFSSGIGYDFSKQLYGGLEMVKEQGMLVSITCIIRYFINDNYFIRSTWATAGSQPSLTIGWLRKLFRIETGFRYHQVLGISPAVILYYLPFKHNDK